MTDIMTREERSIRMSRIRSANTLPEIALRGALHRMGFRFRVNDRELPGKPDIVLKKYRAVVFVHGCFWHRHDGCNVATTPKSNTKFWINKFERNVARDGAAVRALRKQGWRVVTVWECQLMSKQKLIKTAARVASWICK